MVICASNGSRQLVGKGAPFTFADGFGYTFGAFMVAFRPNPAKVDPRFLAHLFQSHDYRHQVDVALSGSSINNLGPSQIEGFVFSFPGIREQARIADALDEADAAIDATVALVQKRTDVMSALVAGLTSGRLRLPGFTVPWREVEFGTFATTYGGLSGKTKDDFGIGEARYVPFLNIVRNEVIDLDDLPKVRITKGENQNRVREGDLLLNGSSETPEEVGLCAVMPTDLPDVYLNSFCFGLRVFNATQVDGLFLALLLRGPVGRELLYSLAQGATRYNLSKSAFLRLKAHFPNRDEQGEIAGIVMDARSAVRAADRQLTKQRNLRTALAQELLSGRTRLP
jgi:type I restriction enzyme S subunit